MPLNDLLIKNAKPLDKPYKLADEKGLFLLVHPNGSKYWRFKYYFGNKKEDESAEVKLAEGDSATKKKPGKKEKLLALGIYPEVKLSEARDKRDRARKLLDEHIDPAVAKLSSKNAAILASENTFEAIGREWHLISSAKWTEKHTKKILARLEKHAFPWLGKRPITDLTAPELLSVLRRVEKLRIIDTAHRLLQDFGQILRYAIATGRAERDVAADLRGALMPIKKEHLATIIDPKEIGNLLRAINDYKGEFVTQCALRLAPLFFVRPGELRRAEWSEFNFVTKEWRIPAIKMKMRDPHIVPLSTQAITILEGLKPLTGGGKYLFPGIRYRDRPMSENTVNCALRRMGYTNDEMTGHGFRSMASTLLNEQGWNRDVIERQLAHAERNTVRASYNYAEYLPERRKMMQAWADYLESLM